MLSGSGNNFGTLLRSVPGKAASALYPVQNKPGQFVTYSYIEGVKLLDVDGNTHAQLPKNTDRAAMAVAPDGDLLLFGNRLQTLQGKELKRLKLAGTLADAAFSTDGQVIATGANRTVQIWSREGKEQASMQTEHPIFSIAVAPDGQRIAVGLQDGSIEVWTTSGRLIQRM